MLSQPLSCPEVLKAVILAYLGVQERVNGRLPDFICDSVPGGYSFAAFYGPAGNEASAFVHFYQYGTFGNMPIEDLGVSVARYRHNVNV